MTYKKNEQKNGLELFNYNNSSIAFRTSDGKVMVNATQMARNFGKQPSDWTKTKQAGDLLKAMQINRSENIPNGKLIEVVRGGNAKYQGTWMHEDVALLFAQWLSPEFYLWCNDRVKEMLLKGNQPKEISQNATEYPENTVITVKMGKLSNEIYIKGGVIYAKFSIISKAMGYSTQPNYYLKRWGNNCLKVTVGKQETWFINSIAFDQMVKLRNDIPFTTIATIYKDLFNIEKQTDGDENPYTYQFTDREMLDVITALNQKPVHKEKVMNLLLGGKKGGLL